jgi:arylsulfatase A
MPFIVRWPGKVKEGAVSEQTICFTDLFATVAEVADAEVPEDGGPDSYSFLSVLKGEQPADRAIRPPVVMESGNGAMLIRSGDWKLINQLGSGGFSKPARIQPGPGDPEGQLYNLALDPGESNNVYLANPEIVARLTAEMRQIVEDK